jgi:lauroyl/myristoyl acyltransferase
MDEKDSNSKVEKNENKLRSVKTGGVGIMFSFSSFIHKYRIYRIFKRSKFLIIILSWIIGKLLIEKTEKPYGKLMKSFKALFPFENIEISYKKKFKPLYKAWITNMAAILLDLMLHMPNLTKNSYSKSVKFNNIEFLDKSLAKGKGVIVPCLHLGNLFHLIAGLCLHHNNYEIVGIANMQNQLLFRELLNNPKLRNLRVVGSDKYSNIKPELIEHLKKNRILLIMYDVVNNRQLRVPFWYNNKKYNYLKRTSQSIVSLHRNTNAPIVPIVVIPDKSMLKSELLVLNSSSIMKISKNFPIKEKRTKKFHGVMSLELNNLLMPFIRKFAHTGSQIPGFGVNDLGDYMKIKPNCEIGEFVKKICQKMLNILNMSYVPKRNDDEIIKLIKISFKEIFSMLKNPSKILWNKGKVVNLSALDSYSELNKLSSILKKVLIDNNEKSSLNSLSNFLISLNNLYLKEKIRIIF